MYCLNLGTCINLEANDANLQAFIDEILENVQLKCGWHVKDFI